MKKLRDEGVEAARVLRAAGWSWRRIADAFGVEAQCVRRRVVPGATAYRRECLRRFRAAHPGYGAFQSLRREASLQANAEGVDRWVVYARWGIDMSYLKWAELNEKRAV